MLPLSLEAIDESDLVRNRLGLDREELALLIASLRDHGQRMPVETAKMQKAGGRFVLRSGWRRLQALRRLRDETADPGFAWVPALVRRSAHAAKAESRLGIFLQVSGGFSHTVLTLSGRGVDPVFRARPEQRLLSGR